MLLQDIGSKAHGQGREENCKERQGTPLVLHVWVLEEGELWMLSQCNSTQVSRSSCLRKSALTKCKHYLKTQGIEIQ